MEISRRQMIAGAASAAGLALADKAVAGPSPTRHGWVKFGMCDWSMQMTEPGALAMAADIGLDGVEVDMGRPETGVHLRKPERQAEYREAMRKTGIEIPSLGIVALNLLPLMSEPAAALWAADAIETTRALGAGILLLPFFAKGELKEENEEDMRRVTEALVELAPRAEDAGVILGFESYLSADAHLKILDVVQSPALKVYYDVKNATDAGHDPIREIRQLGPELICQVHFKDWPYLDEPSGKVDWPAVAESLLDVGYSGWLVIESGCPSKDVVADAKRNLAHLRKLFVKPA